MKGLLRMLMMFGPMIFRQIQKYRSKKSNQAASPSSDNRGNQGQRANAEQK